MAEPAKAGDPHLTVSEWAPWLEAHAQLWVGWRTDRRLLGIEARDEGVALIVQGRFQFPGSSDAPHPTGAEIIVVDDDADHGPWPVLAAEFRGENTVLTVHAPKQAFPFGLAATVRCQVALEPVQLSASPVLDGGGWQLQLTQPLTRDQQADAGDRFVYREATLPAPFSLAHVHAVPHPLRKPAEEGAQRILVDAHSDWWPGTEVIVGVRTRVQVTDAPTRVRYQGRELTRIPVDASHPTRLAHTHVRVVAPDGTPLGERLVVETTSDALLVEPWSAVEAQGALTLLADNWLNEADIAIKYGSSNSGGGYWNYDQYGNSYWMSDQQYGRRYGRNNQPQPIRIGDVLEIAPSEEWRKRVLPTLTTRMQRLFASLHLQVNEEDKAFPWIESLSKTNPKVAQTLVEEFLRIWTKNHNPNDDKQRRNPYIYFYGFDQKADAIPLTRSKQQRNLVELQGWVDSHSGHEPGRA